MSRLLLQMLSVWVLCSLPLGGVQACERGKDCPKHATSAASRRAAKHPELIANNCSFSTEILVRMVLEKGTAWNVRGTLREAAPLATKVAAPFVIGPGDTRVLANGHLDVLAQKPSVMSSAVSLEGRVLNVHGQEYYAVTAVLAPQVR